MVPNSVESKKLLLQSFRDHPLAGHFGVAKTLRAINSRCFWSRSDREVRDYVRTQVTSGKVPILLSQLVCCDHWMYHLKLDILSLRKWHVQMMTVLWSWRQLPQARICLLHSCMYSVISNLAQNLFGIAFSAG